MLGFSCSNRARSGKLDLYDESAVVCMGDGRWFLHELESDIDPEQHTATSDGASNGCALSIDVWTSTDWSVISWHHRPQN